jgi:hypothetical protein
MQKPPVLTLASRYTTLNGIGYLTIGTLLIVWPGVAQTIFRQPFFAGHEQALMRVIGLTVVVGGRFGIAAVHCRIDYRPIGVRSRRIGTSRR